MTFEEAATVFGDPLAVVFNDEDHSIGERREIMIGHSDEHRLLLVAFTERGDKIRIINARNVTKRELRDHEESSIY